MTRQVVPGTPRLIRHYIQANFHSRKDIHFYDKACFSGNIFKIFERERMNILEKISLCR